MPLPQLDDTPAKTQAAPAAVTLAAPAQVVPAAVPAAVPQPVAQLQAVAVPAQTAASLPAAAAVPAVAPPAAPPAASGIVVIRTKGDSWVEVVDAKGGVAVRKIMTPGESVGAGGPLPLQVTIGRADLTEVDVRGARYDLRPVSRDNVARFEIR